MSASDVGQVFGLLLGVYAAGFGVGLLVRYVKRIVHAA